MGTFATIHGEVLIMSYTPDPHPMATAADLLARIATRTRQLGVITRQLHLDLLRETLEHHPWCAGVWSVWNPGALGDDWPHAGQPGHDANGRCMPYWHRLDGPTVLETNQNPELPGFGDYFQLSFHARKPAAVGPYEYPAAKRQRVLFSRTSPILDREDCLGVVGMDLCLDCVLEAANPDSSLADMESRAGGGIALFAPDNRLLMAGPVSTALLEKEFSMSAARGTPMPARLLAGLRPARELDGQGNQDALGVGFLRGPGRATEMRLLRCSHHPFSVLWIRPAPALPGGFSPREGEILHWLAEGKSNEEIAVILGLSAHTVKNHLHRIFQRLGVSSRHAALIAWQDLLAGRSPEAV